MDDFKDIQWLFDYLTPFFLKNTLAYPLFGFNDASFLIPKP